MLSWQHYRNIAAKTQVDVRFPGGMWSILVDERGSRQERAQALESNTIAIGIGGLLHQQPLLSLPRGKK
jgi:hypothetical protein